MATVDAERVRIACSKALVKLAQGKTDAAATVLEELGRACADLVQGERMAQEQSDLREDRFDLAALTVDLSSDAQEAKRPRD
jgi:hypothetical protein